MRDNVVTIAKAIGIILMVVAHAGIPKLFNDFIYMFHMPLFFILSGFCFKEIYLDDPRRFIVNKVKGLYFPFVKWCLFFLILHNFFFSINVYNDVYGYQGKVSHIYTLSETIKIGFNNLRMIENEQLLGGYWFIKDLFFASLIFYIVYKYSKKFAIGGGVF